MSRGAGNGNLVGIDLGTTLSVIAHLDSSGAAITIPNREGDPLTPSAVYIDGSDVIVGKAAKEAATINPDKVATVIKREMGKPVYSRKLDGLPFRPETLSAMILKKLKQDAQRKIGPISRAVITVPAFFDDTRRKATEDAGKIAGLEVLDIINEPTAAALAYSLEGQLHKDGPAAPLEFPGGSLTAVVYDLGGGTFDVTVVRLAQKRFHTLATDGAVQLGGKDWDDTIIDFIRGQFKQQHAVDPGPDPKWRGSVANQAEASKKLLSQLPSVPVECFYQGQGLQVTLGRDQFEEMTRKLIAQTEVVTDLVVSDQAGLSWDDIDGVLLVGGSTRMPMVTNMLRRVTQLEPDDSLDPDQVVARGAAIFAGIHAASSDISGLEIDDQLRDELEGVVVQDVNAHSLGIEAFHSRKQEMVNAILIPKNTQLPFASSKVFKTNKPGARAVQVKVLEGEAPVAEANIPIGECRVTELPPDLAARSPIQVRLSYGTNGRVNVMALDMTGGGFAHAEIQRQAGLTEADIQREAKFVDSLNIQ